MCINARRSLVRGRRGCGNEPRCRQARESEEHEKGPGSPSRPLLLCSETVRAQALARAQTSAVALRRDRRSGFSAVSPASSGSAATAGWCRARRGGQHLARDLALLGDLEPVRVRPLADGRVLLARLARRQRTARACGAGVAAPSPVGRSAGGADVRRPSRRAAATRGSTEVDLERPPADGDDDGLVRLTSVEVIHRRHFGDLAICSTSVLSVPTACPRPASSVRYPVRATGPAGSGTWARSRHQAVKCAQSLR
jgi:hypothetical protein